MGVRAHEPRIVTINNIDADCGSEGLMIEDITKYNAFLGKIGKPFFITLKGHDDPIINPAKGSEKPSEILPDFSLHFWFFKPKFIVFHLALRSTPKKPCIFFDNPELSKSSSPLQYISQLKTCFEIEN